MNSGGMSIVMRSYGSWTAPATSCRMHLRPRDLQLVALAPHLLDEDGQLELAPAADLERVGRLGRADLDGDVAQHLAIEARLELAARHELALATGQRRGVDPERHGQGGLVELQARQGPWIGRIRQRVADGDLRQAGHGHDVARAGRLDVDAFDAPRGGQARDGAGQDRPTGPARRCRRPPPAPRARRSRARPCGSCRSTPAPRPCGRRSRWPTGWSPAAAGGGRARRPAPACGPGAGQGAGAGRAPGWARSIVAVPALALV